MADKKPLFAGLSVAHDPTSAEIYAENFKRERAHKSARAHLKTPATPPERRDIPGRSKYDPPKADARLTMTRGRNGVRNTVGTTSVPNGLRKSAGEKLQPKAKDGRRKTRAAAATRAKGAEKIVYSARIGMTAGRRMTPELRAQAARGVAAQHVETLRARGIAEVKTARVSREDAKEKLRAAIGREREAITRGDKNAAREARTQIRQFRRATQYKGV